MQWIISNKIIFLEKKNQTSFDDCETSVLRPAQKKDWLKGFYLENIVSPFEGRIEQQRMSKERELEVLIRKREEEELETIVGFWNKLSHQEAITKPPWNIMKPSCNHHKSFMKPSLASEKIQRTIIFMNCQRQIMYIAVLYFSVIILMDVRHSIIQIGNKLG